MEASTVHSSEYLLAVHKDAERLLRKRRLGTSVVYYTLFVAIIGTIICIAQMLLTILSGQAWPPSFSSTSWIVFVVGAVISLGAILSLPVGFILLAVNSNRIALITRKYSIENLPSEPEPQLNERFGGYRVIEVTDNTLHVIKARFASATGIIRLLAAPLILAILASVIYTVVFRGGQGHFGQAITYIAFCIIGLGWTVAPVSLQWIVESGETNPCISLECIRWFFFRYVTDMADSELAGFAQYKGTLFIVASTGGKWPLAIVGEDQLAQWKIRRLAAAISQRLGIENVTDSFNEELG